MLVGVVSGLAGIAMTLVLHLVQHLAFGYDENIFLYGVERASPLRRALAPAVGGLVVGLGWWWHRRRWSTDDVSVTHALREADHRLPVGATVVDALLQVVAVGAGGSLGREGAPRQTAAALSGWVAGRVGVTPAQRRTLLACGAGAGLAAVYNVPLAGALFALEILLASVALADVVTALVVSGVAAVVTWPVLSDQPTYRIPHLGFALPVLVWAVPAGLVAGALGVAFTQLMTLARTRAVTGARAVFAIPLAFLGLGLLAIAFPQLLGNGKGPALLAFTGALSLGLAAALTLLKPTVTAVCLGAGAIGGLLTPALATGALAGAVGGVAWDRLWPGAPLASYAVVGAAAVLAVTQRAPFTAVVLTLELVHTGFLLLPATAVAVALALLASTWLERRLDPGRRPPVASTA